MEGSAEIEELSRIAESKLSIKSSGHEPYGTGGHQNPGSSSSSSSLVNVLHRLDRLDLRWGKFLTQLKYDQLKKLEDHGRSTPAVAAEPHSCATCIPNSYQSLKVATINLEKRCRSLAATLEEVQFKGTLVDRVRLLENRISQLSYELDSGSRTSCASLKPSDEIEWLRHGTTYRKHDPSTFQPSDQGPARMQRDGCAQSSQESQLQDKDQKTVGKQKSEGKRLTGIGPTGGGLLWDADDDSSSSASSALNWFHIVKDVTQFHTSWLPQMEVYKLNLTIRARVRSFRDWLISRS